MHVADLLRDDAQLAAAARVLPQDPFAPFPVLMAKIKLTWRCNLRCENCLLWKRADRPEARGGALPTERVKQLITVLARQGLHKLHLSGGEVLLHPGFEEIILQARRHDLQVNLTTNATLIDKALARFLVAERVHAVNISIDGPTSKVHNTMRGVEGAWDDAWRGIELLQRYSERKGRGPALAVNTLITRDTIEAVPLMYPLLKERGVARWRLLPVDTPEKKVRPTPEQWATLAGQWNSWTDILTRMPMHWDIKKHDKSARRASKGQYAGGFYGERRCFAPWFNLFIDANGASFPCCMGKCHMPTLGNVYDHSLDEILTGRIRREIQSSMAAGKPFAICETCDDYLEENAAFERELEEVTP